MVDLVGAALDASPTGPAVRAWLCDVGHVAPADWGDPENAANENPVLRLMDESAAEGVWQASVPVGDDEGVARWLVEARGGIDIGLVEDRDLARAVAATSDLPSWADRWRRTHRLLLPLFDANGSLRGFKARNVCPDARGPKVLSARGFTTSGLVFADGTARALLRGARWPIDAVGGAQNLTVIIAEGGMDWLTWSTWVGEDAAACPVFGIGAGSWTSDIARMVPTGSRVLVRTHIDAAGEGYAGQIAASLGDRCSVYRRGASRGGRRGE